jgi:hypothetical protein
MSVLPTLTCNEVSIPKDKYYEELAKEKHGNYLFSKDGFWHGGIHFNETLNGNNIIVIADGELVAFRINDKYMQNEDDQKAGKDQGFYSTGFFLLKHKRL